MKPGDCVFHQQLGRGTVQRVITDLPRPGVWVDFGYIREFVMVDELQSDQIQGHTSITQKGSREKNKEAELTPRFGFSEYSELTRSYSLQPIEAGHPFEARKGIVALRLGQVLESQVSELSVGIHAVEHLLKKEIGKTASLTPTFVLVEGAWGGGKTHILTLLQALAGGAGFTTTTLVMDGVALSLSEPMLLMEEILNSLVFPKKTGFHNLGEVMRKTVKSGDIAKVKTKGAPDLAILLEKLPTMAFDDSEALGVIQDYLSLSLAATQAKERLKQLGYKINSLPTIKATKVEDRHHAFCVLLRNWANLVAAEGSRGLLVVLDELDVEYASTTFRDLASKERKTRRKHLLEQLKQTGRKKVPLMVAFASAPGADVEVDDDAVADILSIFGEDITHIKVPMPKENEFLELFGKISTLYSQAYDCSNDAFTCDHLESMLKSLLKHFRMQPNPVPRHFVRSTIEALDIFGCCKKPLNDLLHLIGRSR